MKTTRILALLVMIVSIFAMPILASAALPSASVLYLEQEIAPGMWQYDYTVTNTSAPGSDLYSLRLNLGSVINFTGAALPLSWIGLPREGNNTNDFLRTVSMSGASDITAGNSLGGFSFTTQQRIGDVEGDVEYEAEFWNGQNTSIIAGTVAVAPEPVSTVLFLTGGAAMFIRSRMKKNTK